MKRYLLLFALLFATAVQAKESDYWMSWDKAIYMAQQNKKVILMRVTQDDCRYCQRMEQYVFQDEEIKSMILEHFNPVSINVSHEPLPMGMCSHMSPTFFFFDDKKHLLAKIPGAWGKKDFITILQQQMKGGKQ